MSITQAAPPANSVEKLAAANARAVEVRAEWLTRMHRGETTLHETVQFATTRDGRHLLGLGLARLLAAQTTLEVDDNGLPVRDENGQQKRRKWTRAKADRAIIHIHQTLSMPVPEARRRSLLTVKWLIDGRTGGRRVLALADFQTTPGTPYPGFPYAPMPTIVTHAIETATTRRGTHDVR